MPRRAVVFITVGASQDQQRMELLNGLDEWVYSMFSAGASKDEIISALEYAIDQTEAEIVNND